MQQKQTLMKSELIRLALCLALGAGLVSCASITPNESQAKITMAEATKTALSQVSGGVIKTAELEKEHGKLVWSFDIATANSQNITEIMVDANTGKIVDRQIETPADQAREAAADKK